MVNRKDPIILHNNAQPDFTQPTLQKLNELDYGVLPQLLYSPDLLSTDYQFFKDLNNVLQEAENAFQESVESWSTYFYATGINNLFLTGKKNVLIVMLLILINKDVFESSYNDLKVTVGDYNYICTKLIYLYIYICFYIYICVCVYIYTHRRVPGRK